MQKIKEKERKIKRQEFSPNINAINALHDSEKRFRTLIENSTDVIALINPFGKVLYASPSVKKVLGYAPEEFIGTNGLKLVRPKDLPHVMKELSKILLKPGSHAVVEVQVKHKNGSFVWVESRGQNLLHDPNVRAILSNFRDISDIKKKEDDLKVHSRVLESMVEGVSIANEEGIIIYTNPAEDKMFGYKRDELIGKHVTIQNNYPPEENRQIVSEVIKQLTVKGFWSGEWRNKKKDGTGFITSSRITAIEIGGKRHWVCVQEDITEHKKAEIILKESERQLQAILDGSPAVIFLKNLRGQYTLINRQFEKLFKVVRQEVKGKTDYDLFPKDTADHVTKHDKKVIKTGKPLIVEESVPHEDGLHTYVSIKFPLYDSAGNSYAVCGMATDITEWKQIERRKEEFISVASHELKTPITSIKIFTQLLHKRFTQLRDSKSLETLSKMDRQINKMNILIGDLLNLAKIQTGRFEFRREHFDAQDLIDETVESIQATAVAHRIVIKGQITKEIYADRDRISQVLVNFLTNAIKYSPNTNKIIIRLEEDKDEVKISVQDFGIGIPKRDQDKVFERFFRVDGVDEKTYPGFGIGLYVSAEIIRRHNGKIWVKSEKGRGSTFYFTLPIKKGKKRNKESKI